MAMKRIQVTMEYTQVLPRALGPSILSNTEKQRIIHAKNLGNPLTTTQITSTTKMTLIYKDTFRVLVVCLTLVSLSRCLHVQARIFIIHRGLQAIISIIHSGLQANLHITRRVLLAAILTTHSVAIVIVSFRRKHLAWTLGEIMHEHLIMKTTGSSKTLAHNRLYRIMAHHTLVPNTSRSPRIVHHNGTADTQDIQASRHNTS